MAWPLVDSYEAVVDSVRAFNEGLDSHPRLRALLSQFRDWYYVPELDEVGPSKFIGYKNMSAAEYIRRHREELDGRETEAILGRWFDGADAGTPEGARVRSRMQQLTAAHRKTPNRKAKTRKPRGWTLSSRNVVAERPAGAYAPTLPLQRTIKSYVRKGDGFYVAECADIAVVTQGATLDDVLQNLQEAVALHLDGEDLAELGLAPNPSILVTMELEPAYS